MTVEEFLRKTVILQILEEVVGHLDTRFSRMRYLVQSDLCLVPSIAITMPQEAFVKSAQTFAEEYVDDLPHAASLSPELERWHMRCRRSCSSVSQIVPAEVIKECPSSYPNLRKLLQLLCTLPVTSNSCERSFSKLKLLKTYLRSIMKDDRLTSLALLYIHRGLSASPEIVEGTLNLFTAQHKRRMTLKFESLVA